MVSNKFLLYVFVSVVSILLGEFLVYEAAYGVQRFFSSNDLRWVLMVPFYMGLSFVFTYIYVISFKNSLISFSHKKVVWAAIYIYVLSLLIKVMILIYYSNQLEIQWVLSVQQSTVVPGMLMLAPVVFVTQGRSFAKKYFFFLCFLASVPLPLVIPFLWPSLIIYYPLMIWFTNKLRKNQYIDLR